MTELTHHSWVKSRRHMLRCSACGGPTFKVHYIVRQIITIELHSCLQCPLDILGFTIHLRHGVLPSAECSILCFLFVNVHGHDGGALG